MRVLLSGSCVSNDIFLFAQHEHVVAAYLPRMSLATAFAPVVPDHLIAAVKKEIESLTHRYWALNDLEKRLEKMLISTAYDIVLLDFIDERLPLVITENGSLFTQGDTARLAATTRCRYETIPAKSARYFELWKEGLAIFSTLVDPRKVFINRVFWAATANDGSCFAEETTAENNLYLEKLYRHIEDNYAFNFITYDQAVFVGDAQHRWGKFPYHYIPGYYVEAMKALNALESKKVGVQP